MRHQNSVFHQLTKHIPWDVLDASVAAHGADHRVRRLRTRDQFLAILFGQFSGANSLRDIEAGLSSHRARLYHLGGRQVARTSLADANARRPSAVYESVFAEMVRRASPGVRRLVHRETRLLDSTKLKLSGLSAGWARFSADHCGAKLHIAFDPEANLITEARITPDTVNDITPARAMPIEPGATYVFDMAYYSFKWWAELHDQGCRFVTRRRRNCAFRSSTPDTVPRRKATHGTVLMERTGHLSRDLRSTGKNPFTAPVREIIVARDGAGPMRLLTNDLDAPAEEIAALYKQRWEIELLFKWLKQNLRIRRFIGTSENAVRTQVFIALIAYMILCAAHGTQNNVNKLQQFTTLIRMNIMQRRPVNALKEPPPDPTKDPRQPTLDLSPC